MLSQNVLSAKRALLPCGASARTGARASVKIRHHARVQSRSLIPCGRFGHVTSAASLDRNESFHDEDEFTRTSRGVIKEEILGESGPNGVDNVIVDPTKLKSLDQGDKDAVSPAADEKQSTLKVSETAVAETYRKEILGVAIPSLGMGESASPFLRPFRAA